MKILLIALLIPCISFCQVRKFKCFQSFYSERPGQDVRWNDNNILVVIDVDNDKIKTFGRTEGDYDLIQEKSSYTSSDGDAVGIWKAVDEKGRKCEITLIIFKDQSMEHIATISFKYGESELFMRLKLDQ